MTQIRTINVVVPARNEEARLGRCLASLETASQAAPPGIRVDVTIVLDSCTDSSADIVARWPHFNMLSIDAGSVGAARSAGFEYTQTAWDKPESVWLACTDADSQVPREWLSHQLKQANLGADLLLGLVRVDEADLSRSLRRSWARAHGRELAEAMSTAGHHRNVHGANLGVRADWYAAVGGFAHVPEHEDKLLTDSIRARGGKVVYSVEYPVLTSGRRAGRTPGGFAGFLRELERETAMQSLASVDAAVCNS